MRFNEQYIPIHRLLGWIMGWDPQWVADPSQAGPHMTKTLSWFNDPGYQEEKKNESFWFPAEMFQEVFSTVLFWVRRVVGF